MTNSVNRAFIELHKKDLVYRDLRMINWCCALKSAISDAEVLKMKSNDCSMYMYKLFDKID
jgi:valyl-tRNA synthetase